MRTCPAVGPHGAPCSLLPEHGGRHADARGYHWETAPSGVAPYLRLYKHAGTWVAELWLGDVGSRRSSAFDEFKGTYIGSATAADALARGLEMLAVPND